jgi:hypothetical protein
MNDALDRLEWYENHEHLLEATPMQATMAEFGISSSMISRYAKKKYEIREAVTCVKKGIVSRWGFRTKAGGRKALGKPGSQGEMLNTTLQKLQQTA